MCDKDVNVLQKPVPGDFVSPGPFHMSTSAYDYIMVTSESPVTSAVNSKGLEVDKCTSAVNIEGHGADKWIVVRGKKNGSKTSYLLEPD